MPFNLNLLECKSQTSITLTIAYDLLISTYWNVNNEHAKTPPICDILLISTYWNVNCLAVCPDSFFAVSFNLNLLECKYVWLQQYSLTKQGF